MEKPLVSVVIPCLNEEATIGAVVQKAHDAFSAASIPFEVLVADNGSKDRSRDIAKAGGARVSDVKTRGYGVALRTAIQKAAGEIVIFGDADLTYDFGEGPALIQRLQQGDADVVIGTRLKGSIETGAMPWTHRYVGTPFLTTLINLLFKTSITDSNSGFRAFRVQTFRRWNLRSNGMEICSELIVNCVRSGHRIAEVPITLHKDRRTGGTHLSTWRDGTRNLLIILSRAPHGFTYIGLTLLLLSLLVAVPSALLQGATIGPFSVFEHHSMILAILIGFLGAQSMFYGLLLDASSAVPLTINKMLLDIKEVRLLQILGTLLVMTGAFTLFIFTRWIQHHFNNINYLLPSLTVLYIAVIVGTLGFGLFVVQLQRNAPRLND